MWNGFISNKRQSEADHSSIAYRTCNDRTWSGTDIRLGAPAMGNDYRCDRPTCSGDFRHRVGAAEEAVEQNRR